MNVDALREDHDLLPFLPMIYVAWADGELSEDEIAEIRQLASEQEYLGEKSQDVLTSWLDPNSPPTASELHAVLADIREAAAELPGSERRSLAELGVEIARTDGAEDEKVQRALVALEEALEVVGSELTAQLLQRERPCPPPCGSHKELEPEANFDIGAMTDALDGPYKQARDEIRELLSRPVFSYHDELDKETQREKVYEWLQILAEEGIGRKAFPKYTGEGEDMGEFSAIFETLSFFDLSLVIKFGVQFGLFGGSIYFLGTQKHHEAYLDEAASVELPGCFAMTELGHGSNVRDLATTATFDVETQEWIIDTPNEMARKEWIGNAATHGRMATVFAQLETQGERYGVHAFLVPIRGEDGEPLEGVFIDDCGHKMGLNGVDNGRLWFEQVRVPAENLLNRYATVDEEGNYDSPIASDTKRFFTMLGTLVGGRVSIAKSANSAAKSALAIAVRYAAMRRQFGPSGKPESTILNFRTHQRRLMPRVANTYALSFATQYLSDRYVGRTEEDEREVEALAAGFKAWSSWNATDTIQVCRECCGGQGYLTTNRLPSLKADTDIFTTFEGDNTVLMQLVAKSLLNEYAQQFQDLSFFSTLRFLAGQARTQLNALDPVSARRTDPEYLRDAEVQLRLWRHRETMLIGSVARRFKRRVDDGMDSFEAMIEVQDHLVSTARAHIDRVILEQFIEAVDGCQDEALKARLDELRALFGLWHTSEDMGWFMENSLIEAPQAKAMRTEINELCYQVRQQAVHLVDAYGIPESCLGAPIAYSPVVEPRRPHAEQAAE